MSKSSWRHTNASIARDIKVLVWNGYTQARVAKHFGLSQSTVNRIVNGLDFDSITWPDGSTGPLPIARRRAIRTIRQNLMEIPENGAEEASLPEDLRNRLRQAVEQYADETDERKLLEALHAADQGEHQEPGSDETSRTYDPEVPKILFAEVARRAPTNPLVKKALRSKRKQQAIELVFASITEDMWESEMAERLVKEVEGKI